MTATVSDREAIEGVLDRYMDAARSGLEADFRRDVFREDATICGYVGDDLFSMPIASFYEWNNENGPAKDVTGETVSVDIAGTVATARMEIHNWTGHRFTDMFTLLKSDGQWRVVSKVFYMHPEGA